MRSSFDAGRDPASDALDDDLVSDLDRAADELFQAVRDLAIQARDAADAATSRGDQIDAMMAKVRVVVATFQPVWKPIGE